MTAESEHKTLVTALVERLAAMTIEVTHVLGDPDYPDPPWQNWKDEWELPDIVAEDRSRGLIVIGEAETGDSWNAGTMVRKLGVFRRCAHQVFVMVPEQIRDRAQLDVRKARYGNVTVVTPDASP